MASSNWSIIVDTKLDTSSIKKQLNQVAKETKLNVSVDGATKSTKEIDTLSESTKNAADNAGELYGQYYILNQLFQATIGVISDVVSQVIELDDALTEFKKVSSLSGDALDDYVESLAKSGQEVARTSSEMVDAATTFRKSGFNDEDSAKLATVAAMFQNVADTEMSASDAAASIVSQIRAFGFGADEATKIIDSYNAVANNFAVGTNDLSQAMEVAGSGMATYGNDFNEVLGLVTAGSEILQGKSLQVARGLSTIASRIVKNKDTLAEYGIEVEYANGSLKSTYDILKELKPQWDAMSDAQKVSLGDTLAGTNQYKVLSAVMQNFDQAVSATQTSLNSAGSAAEENARYMESLSSKIANLKGVWQDFANKVFPKELIASVLDGFTSLVSFLDNDFVATLTGVGTSLFAVLTGVGLLTTYFNLLKTKAVVPLIGTLSKLAKFIAGPWGMAIAGASAVVVALTAVIAENNKTLTDYQTEIDSATEKLQSNQDRLQEINNLGWQDKTSEIYAEQEALEDENKSLEKQIELLKSQKAEKAKSVLSDASYETGKTTTIGGTFIGETDVAVYTHGAEAMAAMTDEANRLSDALQKNNSLSQEESDVYTRLLPQLSKCVEAAEALGSEYIDSQPQLKQMVDSYYNLVNAYDTTTNAVNKLSEASGVADKELVNQIYTIIAVSNTKLDVSQKVAALQTLASQAGATSESLLSVIQAAMIASNVEFVARRVKQGDTSSEANRMWAANEGAYWTNLISSAKSQIKTTSSSGTTYTPTTTSTTNGTTKTSSSTSSTAVSTEDKQLTLLKQQLQTYQDLEEAINDKYDAQIDALEKSNEQLEKEVELEKLLENMASARSQKKMVWTAGGYQYISDVDAIAEAQDDLNDYYREAIAEQKKVNIEAARNKELSPVLAKQEILEAKISKLQGYASGTTYASGGLSLVGEHGAELRVLNQGDGIIPNGLTTNLMKWGQMSPSQILSDFTIEKSQGGLYFNGVNMSFPNVHSGADAQAFVTNLKNLAYQRAYSRA